jgi:hypothetical protein
MRYEVTQSNPIKPQHSPSRGWCSYAAVRGFAGPGLAWGSSRPGSRGSREQPTSPTPLWRGGVLGEGEMERVEGKLDEGGEVKRRESY